MNNSEENISEIIEIKENLQNLYENFKNQHVNKKKTLVSLLEISNNINVLIENYNNGIVEGNVTVNTNDETVEGDVSVSSNGGKLKKKNTTKKQKNK